MKLKLIVLLLVMGSLGGALANSKNSKNMDIVYSGKQRKLGDRAISINGAMEKTGSDNLPVGWSEFHFSGVETVGSIVADNIVRNGRKSVKISWKNGASGFGISYKMAEVANKNYEFSAWGKTAGAGKLQIMVMAYDKYGDIVMSAQSNELKSTKKWSKLGIIFTVPKKTASLRLLCLNKGTGNIWYDDAELKYVEKSKFKASFPVSLSCEPAFGNAIWNDWRPIFSTFSNSPCSLTFDFWGDKSKLKNPSFVIELPSEITIAHCFNSHGNIKKPAMQPKITTFIFHGKPWKRYTYLNPEAILIMKITPSFGRRISVLFKANADNTEGKEFPAVAYVSNGGKKGKVKNFYIKMLPPMKSTPNPKNFYVHLWNNYDIAVSDNDLFKNILTHYEEAGITGRVFNTWGRNNLYEQDRICRNRGWKMHLTIGDSFIKKSLKANGISNPYATDYKGNRNHHFCPSILLSDSARSGINREFIKYAKEKKLKGGDMVVFDYEPWGTLRWCFCPRCLSRFSKFIGVNKVLKANEIRKKTKKEWTEFRLNDTDKISSELARIVKKYNPAIKVGDYDYPMNFEKPGFESRFQAIPKDSRKSDKYLDVHFSSFYYTLGKQGFEMVDINRRKLKKGFFMLPLLTRYSDPTQSRYTRGAKCTLSPKRIRMTILNCATAGGSGQSFWTGEKIDGQYFLAIDQAMNEVAKLEDIMAQGKRIDEQVQYKLNWKSKANALDSFGMRVLEFKGMYLICLFNYHPSEPIAVNLKFSPTGNEKWQVDNPTTKKKYLNPNGKNEWTTTELKNGIDSIEVLPEDVKFITIMPYNI